MRTLVTGRGDRPGDPRVRLRRVILAAALCLWLGLSDVRGQSFPVLNGHDVGYVLHVDDHPALGAAFIRRSRQRLERMLTTLLGYQSQVKSVDTLPLHRWLRDHQLQNLTPDQCRSFGLDAQEKTIVLRMAYRQGAYDLSALEYDRHFDSVDRMRHVRVIQRDLVPDTLGRLALRCWTPVGEIIGQSDDRFHVRFNQSARLTAVSSWSRVAPGAVLQLYREAQTGTGIRQQGRTDQFLVVGEVHEQHVDCKLALTGESGTWFQYVGDPRARYLVRRVTPASDRIMVKVVFRDSLLPREGCAVSISREPAQAGEVVGHTGPAGRFATASSGGVQYVTVQYESQQLRKVCLPGVTPGPLLFHIAPRTDFGAMDARIASLEDQLRDNISVVNDIIREMNEAAKLRDVTRMEQLVARAEQTSFERLERGVSELVTKASASGAGIPPRLKTLQADLRKAQKQTGLEKFSEALLTGRQDVLKQKIAVAYNESRWKDAEQLLKDYVKLAPEDATAGKRLSELTAGLPVRSPAHEAARNSIERLRGITRVEDLVTHWNELSDALSLLGSLRDRLWLMTAEKEFKTWLTLINDEVTRIKRIADSGTTLDQTQRDDLAARAKEIEAIGPALSTLVDQTDQILSAS